MRAPTSPLRATRPHENRLASALVRTWTRAGPWGAVEVGEARRRAFAAEHDGGRGGPDAVVEGTGLEVVVSEEDDGEVSGRCEGVADGLGDADGLCVGAEVGPPHSLERALVGGERRVAGDEAVAC